MSGIDHGTPGPDDTDREVYRQVMGGLRGTIADDAKISRPVYDLDGIQRGLQQLKRQQFTSTDKGARLELEAKVHFAPSLARTDASAIILSIKRQTTALAVLSAIGNFLSGLVGHKTTKPKTGNDFLRLTPNGYQVTQTAEALNRRTPLHEYTPEAANPIGEITTEFLKHLRRTLDAER